MCIDQNAEKVSRIKASKNGSNVPSCKKTPGIYSLSVHLHFAKGFRQH